MRFQDIPQLTRSPNYSVTLPWYELENTLERYNERGVLRLDPDFQRAHVWTENQQRRYIEFILRGGQSSRDIYFNQADWNRSYRQPMYLVDGKQRIEAVRKFLRNELHIFPLSFNRPYGYKLSDFSDRLDYRAAFIFHVNDLKTYKEVLQWYIDLNAGGVAHTKDEIDRVKMLLESQN